MKTSVPLPGGLRLAVTMSVSRPEAGLLRDSLRPPITVTVPALLDATADLPDPDGLERASVCRLGVLGVEGVESVFGNWVSRKA